MVLVFTMGIALLPSRAECSMPSRTNRRCIGERVQWSVELTMTGFGRVVLQPSIGFGAKARQGVGLRCRAYEIPATQLLLPASKDVYGSDVLFQYWAGLPFGATMDAVSSIPGPEAGLYVMSALQAHSHTTMVLGNTVPVSGGFKAAAMGLTQEGDTVGIVINGALASGQEGAEVWVVVAVVVVVAVCGSNSRVACRCMDMDNHVCCSV